jgi:glycerol-3-phosphate responsive antiterminator
MDFTTFTTEELEKILKDYKEKLSTMVINPDLIKIIGDAEVIEFILKSRKEDGQKNNQPN